MNPEDIGRLFYMLLDTSDPTIADRLMNPATLEDCLLRIQADPLLDHTRLYRVARARAAAMGTENYLEPVFQQDFDNYLAEMTDIGRMIAECIPHRYVLTNSREAMCIETACGRVIVVSEVLRYALYFMNLAFGELYGLPSVPDDVQGHAMIVAARTMIMTEALDFDLDPRGIVPNDIDAFLRHMTEWQMKFVIGHEFSHHRFGHKGLGLRMTRPIRNDPGEGKGHEWQSYKRSWHEEYEADIGAIEEIEGEDSRKLISTAAILFFLYLEFFERIEEALDATLADIDTHPPTSERLRNVVDKFGILIDVDWKWAAAQLESIQDHAKAIIEIYNDDPNLLLEYGSAYLGSWKGPDLIDRVDY
ncbi:hypothetical protein VH569_26665 [Azospirillum sp. 11R-A]|uniref:hypothetical protein n=1 Tax=Azospirillum sp. 11R-A TaxID=3111634 RepID=UPI003C179EF6